MHRGSTRTSNKQGDGAPPGWTDLTTTADGKTRTECPSLVGDVNDEVQCAFKDLSTGLIWSSRAPGLDGFREAREFLTWSDAKSSCEKLGRWSGMDGWRLPTDSELASAFLTPSGTIRQSGLLGLTDGKLSFGALPKYSFIWSITEDPANTSQAKALFRGPTSISVGAVAKDMARGWHCVHASSSVSQPLLTETRLPPPNTYVAVEPTPSRQPAAPQALLPTVRPSPATAADARKNIVLGSSLTTAEPPKWALQPINDLSHLKFLTAPLATADERTPAVSSPTAQPKPAMAPPVVTRQPQTTLPAESVAASAANKSARLVKALRRAFGKIGMAHAIDNDGRLVLNRATGVSFPSGEGALSSQSIPRAKNMLRIYTEVILAEVPEIAASARLRIVGYSTPTTDTNAANAQANKKISRRRAELIRDLVHDLNIWPSDQLTIDGRGGGSPVKRNDGNSGSCGIYDCELSRRVEISTEFRESPT